MQLRYSVHPAFHIEALTSPSSLYLSKYTYKNYAMGDGDEGLIPFNKIHLSKKGNIFMQKFFASAKLTVYELKKFFPSLQDCSRSMTPGTHHIRRLPRQLFLFAEGSSKV